MRFLSTPLAIAINFPIDAKFRLIARNRLLGNKGTDSRKM